MVDSSIIDKFFNPKSIAVIGASRKPYGAAHTILSSVIYKNYAGDIYLVNNSACGEKLYERPLYKTILDCPKVDLAFIVVPGKYVKSVIEDCIELGITNGVIISSGFKESILYDESKVKLEKEILALARENGLRLIGPNCNGVINLPTSFYAFFGPRLKVQPGHCSYVTRGGTAGGFILMGSAQFGRDLGVNKLVNIGDACDLTIGDFIQYYEQDPLTKVIGVYTEGITNGSKLLQILRKVKKPVIFYKSGQTTAGQRAALSHVGAIASAETSSIYQGFITQAGVIPANSLEDMLDLAAAFSHSVLPQGNKIGIFTFGGSLGVMMTDAAEKHGLNVAPLKQALIETLNDLLPEYWSHSNPIDITDGGSVYNPSIILKLFARILEEYDSLFLITPVFENEQIWDYKKGEMNFRNMYREFIKQNVRRYKRLTQSASGAPNQNTRSGKPIFVLGEYGKISDLFYKHGIPLYESFEQMAKAFAGLLLYTKVLKKKKIMNNDGRISLDII